MASIGYARVSTKDQNLDMQIDALREAGCDPIFSESVSSSKERPELFMLTTKLFRWKFYAV